jgi:hypothetical protein
MRALLCCLVACVACEGSTPKGPDAAHFCAGSAYDPCNDEHSCPLVSSPTGPVCQPVGSGSQTFVVCTLACTPSGTACPDDKTGAPGTCVVPSGSDTGLCAPAAPDICTPNPNS